MTESRTLPFIERPDLTPFLVHLTKNTKAEDNFSAFNNLYSILATGEIWGSNTEKGFIKGKNKAACFMDIPLQSIKYLMNEKNTAPEKPRYEPYGIILTKEEAYIAGARPVIYLSNDELSNFSIPEDELWRIVRFEGMSDNDVNWIHEREWRIKGGYKLPKEILAVVVRDVAAAKRMRKLIEGSPEKFKCKPQSIIPLSVLCQGLPYMTT